MLSPQSEKRAGLFMALGAYVIWGLLPLYLRLAPEVPPFEFVGWRVLFTLPVCAVLLAATRQFAALRAALAQPRSLAVLCVSGVLIGGNWLIYIWAVAQGHFFAASLGYYINPLANVLLGTLVLGERLSRLQWAAVALAALGVSLLAWDARDMLWISLTLAASFSVYGLVRKLVPVGPLPGLTIEAVILLLPALALVHWYWIGPAGTAMGKTGPATTVLALSGLVTAVPLLLFAGAARRMDYSTLGFVQYLSPTIVFLLGLFVFREPLKPLQLACFLVIWAAIALFTWDLLARRRRQA